MMLITGKVTYSTDYVDDEKKERPRLDLDSMIKEVIYNYDRTIVKWKNGDKTVVKCGCEDEFDKEKGLLAAIVKYVCGNTSRYNAVIRKWANRPRYNDPDDDIYILTDKGRAYLDSIEYKYGSIRNW